jgi:hypothetical protein
VRPPVATSQSASAAIELAATIIAISMFTTSPRRPSRKAPTGMPEMTPNT